MKRNNILIIIFLLLFLISNIYASKNSSLKLNFSIGAIKHNNNTQNIIPIDMDTVLKEDDGIRLLFQPASDCYIYVLFYDSSKQMTLLFPNKYNYYKKNYAVKGMKYFLPDAWDWYPLDNNPGIETIYFIASTTRLTDLEKQIKKLDSKKTSQILKASSEIRNNIRRKISKQLTKNYNFQERNAIEIAGVIRAVKNDIEEYTKGLIGEDLIIKTIIFKHEKK